MVRIDSFIEEVLVSRLSRSLHDEISSSGGSQSEPDAVYPISDDYTESQEIILTWTLRTAATVSFVSGIYIFLLAWKRREYVYHRLMLGK